MGFSQTLLTHPIFAAGILTLKSVSVVIVLSSSLKINFFCDRKDWSSCWTGQDCRNTLLLKSKLPPFHETLISKDNTFIFRVETLISQGEG